MPGFEMNTPMCKPGLTSSFTTITPLREFYLCMLFLKKKKKGISTIIDNKKGLK